MLMAMPGQRLHLPSMIMCVAGHGSHFAPFIILISLQAEHFKFECPSALAVCKGTLGGHLSTHVSPS